MFVFQVKTTNPKKYCVRPNTGIVTPRSTCDVIGTNMIILNPFCYLFFFFFFFFFKFGSYALWPSNELGTFFVCVNGSYHASAKRGSC